MGCLPRSGLLRAAEHRGVGSAGTSAPELRAAGLPQGAVPSDTDPVVSRQDVGLVEVVSHFVGTAGEGRDVEGDFWALGGAVQHWWSQNAGSGAGEQTETLPWRGEPERARPRRTVQPLRDSAPCRGGLSGEQRMKCASQARTPSGLPVSGARPGSNRATRQVQETLTVRGGSPPKLL